MWITGDGVLHTAALPDPAAAMTELFRNSLDSLFLSTEGSILDILEEDQDALTDEFNENPPPDAHGLEAQGLPDHYLDGEFSSVDDLMGYLRNLDPSWRLDAYLAVDDFITRDFEPLQPLGWLRSLLTKRTMRLHEKGKRNREA